MEETLLVQMLDLEKVFGRTPKEIFNEPRPLDLDLIAFGTERRATTQLTLPHPRLHLRRFVLEPLAEIVPEWRHPREARTVSDLLTHLDDPCWVRRIEAQP